MSIQNVFELRRHDIDHFPERHASFPAADLVGVAAGSRVQTQRGEILIENLCIGHEVLTSCGLFAKVKARNVVQPSTWEVALLGSSVRIRRDAFGPMQPCHDVVVGPGQLVFVDDRSEMAAALINGRTVVRDAVRSRMIQIALQPAAAMMVECLAIGSAATHGADQSASGPSVR